MLNTKLISAKKARAKKEDQSAGFFVVGIGGSAGGLSAFIELLKNIPADTNLAFVVVQHLLADAKSGLSEILSGKTKLPVNEVAKDTAIKPGRVYVIPPNRNITLKGEKLRLSPRNLDVLNLPIDKFFISLAQERNQNAIGVILSGTGSDGTLGMKAIREAGGTTFAQDKDAAFGDMPESVAKAGLADYILNPAKIAEKLLEIAGNPSYFYSSNDIDRSLDAIDGEDKNYRKILKLILDSSEVDFTYYKPGTLKRRIKRRMDIKNIKDIGEYTLYLEKNPKEAKALYQDILIKVTNFFRDQSMFDFLKSNVFPAIFKEPPQSFRIWAPGCSTGEEVYSLAICLADFMEKNKINIPVQIFGTDISEQALDAARQAMYPKNIEANVSAKTLSKYFIKSKDNYTINPAIRAMCVFARHNMVKDVPFTKMDIVSCRNVLIYLDSVLQKRAFPVFHYALKPKGFLILGTAETASSFNDLFSTISQDQKVYSKKAGASIPRLNFAAPNPPTTQTIKTPELESSRNFEEIADKIVLRKHSPSGVIINEDLTIIQFRGDVSPYLKHPSGRASLDLIKMTHKALLAKLLEMIKEAGKNGTPVIKTHAGLKTRIEVIPLDDHSSPERHFLILFKQEELREINKNELAEPAKIIIEAEEALAATVAQLQSLLETRDTANEELRSANEEVMSANEELQSTNEELETTKEELQSANEELMTLNSELRHRNLDLRKIEESHNQMVPKFELRGDELSRKDEFISVLGHELRNSLAPIMHSVELANIQGVKDPEISKLIKMIERHAIQMKNIINDLLDTARAQRGKLELKPETVNLNDIIGQAVDAIRVFVDSRRHSLKLQPSKKQILLSIDPSRVIQIITNLINNAAKYTPAGGKIIISVSTEDGKAKLSVRDSGIGISEEMLPKIFDIFSQAVQPLDDNKGGLGVGLMLARSLAELHGGSLTAASPGLGRGSEFILELPINEQTENSTQPAEEFDPAIKRLKKRKIIVVDDNIAIANLMGKLFHALDQEVVVAYDGASVIDLVNTGKPDLIFVDISMPKMDGYALIKILREKSHLKETKIMALSGFGDEYRQKSIKAGFDMHLTKPLSINELEKILLDMDAAGG
jgi:two-component system, chemotaxis family, CheB/CheR fusion protein